MTHLETDRRAVLGGLAALSVSAVAPAAAAAGPANFLVIGDWGYEGGRRQAAVAAAMAATAARACSRFVLSVGDNFYPAGVSSADDPQWRSSFEEVYAAESLQVPWCAALGNHDYRGVPEAQVAYSERSTRWRMPSRYFTISGAELGVPGLEVFVMDTTPLVESYDERLQQLRRGHLWREDGDRQLAWLAQSLARSNAPWKIVVGHHPIHSGGRHGGAPQLIARVKPLLEAHGVQTYLCGHDHALQHISIGGVDYVCSGAGAASGKVRHVEGLKFAADCAGFASFDVEGDTLLLRFRDETGAALYGAALRRER